AEEHENSVDQILMAEHFPATVEFVSHTFHLQSTDSCAYKLVRVLSSWRKKSITSKIESKTIFSVELLLGRTRCEKFEDDIDNCPFQEIPELNHVRQDTSFPPGHSCGCRMGCGVDTGAADKASPWSPGK
uniref:Cystatin domain-containing protein n=1 Tax=Chlorocebus sabaeus TaxID=60711 RepID=A0A0D9RF50_CHLSB